jgi:hypothetical protein
MKVSEIRRRRWSNNIKMDLKEIICEDGRCKELVQYSVQLRAGIESSVPKASVFVVRNLQVAPNLIHFSRMKLML